VYVWCLQAGFQAADAADVVQDIFRTVLVSIDRLRHGGPGDSFRGWLRMVTRSRVRDALRRNGRQAGGEGGSEAQNRLLGVAEALSESSTQEEDEFDRRVLMRRATDLTLARCGEVTRQAFIRVVVGEEAVEDVARDLGLTPNAVYVAKSRILRKIRETFELLIDF
jgi:RNA polymerase sigma-70 factor (ECF subfamily)